jgi:uncharacterized protein (TIGR03067 family)
MTDIQKLQGCWNIKSLEVDGARMPAPSGARIVIEAGRFQSLGMGAVYEGKIEVDAAQKPKSFDLVFTKGPEKGNRSLGIYKLQGGTWTICMTVTGTKRPKTFATTAGSGLALETLKRGETAGPVAKKGEEVGEEVPPAPSTANDPAPELEGKWEMTACTSSGQAVPDQFVKTGRRSTGGGRTQAWFGKQTILDARYTVDRSAEPHTIDYTLKNGDRQYGIWKFEGGILHLVMSNPGTARPSDFTSKSGDGRTLTSWERVK